MYPICTHTYFLCFVNRVIFGAFWFSWNFLIFGIFKWYFASKTWPRQKWVQNSDLSGYGPKPAFQAGLLYFLKCSWKTGNIGVHSYPWERKEQKFCIFAWTFLYEIHHFVAFAYLCNMTMSFNKIRVQTCWKLCWNCWKWKYICSRSHFGYGDWFLSEFIHRKREVALSGHFSTGKSVVKPLFFLFPMFPDVPSSWERFFSLYSLLYTLCTHVPSIF